MNEESNEKSATNKVSNTESERIEQVKVSPIDQWIGLTHQLSLHRKLNVLLGVMVLCFMFLTAAFVFQDPLVAVLSGDQKERLFAQRQPLEIGEAEIARVVEEFVRLRYQWASLEPEGIITHVSPLVTWGLKEKLLKSLKDLKKNGFRGKKTTQKVSGVEVSFDEKNVLVHFDKVLRVEGIPLVVPTGLSLSVVKGAQTKWNPAGVYINGVLESSSK